MLPRTVQLQSVAVHQHIESPKELTPSSSELKVWKSLRSA